jgi:acyl phosphate:glycerol-3-phosphate acyltransferase
LLTTYLTIAFVSYLLGSIPFGYILVRLFLKQDIRQTGSGNIGATNVARSGAKGLAIATLLLDAAKGFLAVVVASGMSASFRNQPSANEMAWTVWSSQRLYDEIYLPMALAALCAIIGHCFPVWLRFKGGKGVATAVGACAVVSPLGTLISVLVFALVVAATRYVSLGSVLAAAIFPFTLPFVNPGSPGWKMVALASAASATIILKHHANIRRLLNGTEHRFGTPKLPADPIKTEKNA